MTNWEDIFAGISASAAVLAAITAHLFWSSLTTGCYIWTLVSGLFFIPFATVAFLCLHVLALVPAQSHSWLSLKIQYMLMGIFPFLGYFYNKRAQKTVWKNCGATQEDVLLNILKHNAESQYGIEHGLKNIKSKAEFVKQHPVTNYDHYSKYINDVLDGKDNVMFPDKVAHFATSSGTSGKSKIFPVHNGILFPKLGYIYFSNMVNIVGCSLNRIIGLRYKPTVNYSKNNIAISPLSYFTAPHSVTFLSPPVVSQISDETTALYLHALFGLAEKNVYQIDGLLSSVALTFFKVIEDKWKDLVADIEQGTISANLNLDKETRNKISPFLKANPERAKQLIIIFKNGFNKRLVKRLWPSCQGMLMLAGGSFYNSTKLLQEKYAGGIPVMSYTHGASEGLVGVAYPNGTGRFSYVILPEFSFYEFIPVEECDQEKPKTLFLEELEVGRSYEVVMTTNQGLYRYRLGDVIQITGHMQQCPIYEFLYRRGQMLNVSWEKTPESLFYQAVEMTVRDWPNITLVDYTSTENINAQFLPDSDNASKHYILFVELQENTYEPNITQRQKQQFDLNLCHLFELYETLRADGTISMMKVIQVKLGSFQMLRQMMTVDTNSIQFKMPRVIRKPEHIKGLTYFRV